MARRLVLNCATFALNNMARRLVLNCAMFALNNMARRLVLNCALFALNNMVRRFGRVQCALLLLGIVVTVLTSTLFFETYSSSGDYLLKFLFCSVIKRE
jgi:hypothetical protein